MKRLLLLPIILLTASVSLSLSIKNVSRVNVENMSGRSLPCVYSSAPSVAQMPPHTPGTDVSMIPAPTSLPTIRNITCNATLTSSPSNSPTVANIITTVLFRVVITILSLLNTNFAWRIHGKPRTPSIYNLRLIATTAHHAQQRLRLARENLHLGRI